MANELYDVYSFTDFIDDWMFHSASSLQLSNAMLTTFLLNRGHVEYTARDGIIFDMNRCEQQHHDMRRRYFTLMDQQIENHNRFGLLLVSPFGQTRNDYYPTRLSCHSLTMYSGSPKRSAKQLLKAINNFKYSPEWSYMTVQRDGEGELASFGVPVRMIVFEMDNYWKGTVQSTDTESLQKLWLMDVSRNLETHYVDHSPFSLRLYMLKKFCMQMIGADLVASCRPLIRPLNYTDNLIDDFSCSDSSEYDSGH